MLSWKRLALLAAVAMGTTLAQPALTTIQDILYRAVHRNDDHPV